jgi:hypothetical protein
MSKDITEDLRKDMDPATDAQDDAVSRDSHTAQDGAGAMVCGVCDVPMEPMKSTFSYLKREFRHTVLRCPICGQIYISEDLAKGKMREVETILEEK